MKEGRHATDAVATQGRIRRVLNCSCVCLAWAARHERDTRRRQAGRAGAATIHLLTHCLTCKRLRAGPALAHSVGLSGLPAKHASKRESCRDRRLKG